MYAHTRGDIDMQIVELILSKAQTLKVGEVSLIDGKKSMCINVDGFFVAFHILTCLCNNET